MHVLTREKELPPTRINLKEISSTMCRIEKVFALAKCLVTVFDLVPHVCPHKELQSFFDFVHQVGHIVMTPLHRPTTRVGVFNNNRLDTSSHTGTMFLEVTHQNLHEKKESLTLGNTDVSG